MQNDWIVILLIGVALVLIGYFLLRYLNAPYRKDDKVAVLIKERDEAIIFLAELESPGFRILKKELADSRERLELWRQLRKEKNFLYPESPAIIALKAKGEI